MAPWVSSICLHRHFCVFVTSYLGWQGLSLWPSGKESSWQCWRCGFDPWVGKILWRRRQQSTPGLAWRIPWTDRSLAGYSPWGCKESDMPEQLDNNNLGWHGYPHARAWVILGENMTPAILSQSISSHFYPFDALSQNLVPLAKQNANHLGSFQIHSGRGKAERRTAGAVQVTTQSTHTATLTSSQHNSCSWFCF